MKTLIIIIIIFFSPIISNASVCDEISSGATVLELFLNDPSPSNLNRLQLIQEEIKKYLTTNTEAVYTWNKFYYYSLQAKIRLLEGNKKEADDYLELANIYGEKLGKFCKPYKKKGC